MPNLITHYYFAQQVSLELRGKAEKLIDKHPDAYKLGVMGPDFMFTLREFKFKERMLPNAMQYLNVYEVFALSGEYILSEKDEVVYAYILGLLCHYVADFIIHPYVNYFVERHTAKHLPVNQIANIHTLIESAIDAHICDEMYNIASNKFVADKVAKASMKTRMKVSRFYEKVVNEVFGFKARAGKFNFAFVATKILMKLSIDKKGFKKKFFDRLENLFGGKKLITGLIHPPEGYQTVDYMNNNKLPWLIVRNGEEYSNESVYEILERAKHTAVQYINSYTSFVSLGKPLNKKDFAINYEGVQLY